MYNISPVPRRFLLAVHTKPGGLGSLFRWHHGSEQGVGLTEPKTHWDLGLGWYKIFIGWDLMQSKLIYSTLKASRSQRVNSESNVSISSRMRSSLRKELLTIQSLLIIQSLKVVWRTKQRITWIQEFLLSVWKYWGTDKEGADKEDAFCEVEASIPTGPWINIAKLLNVFIEQARRSTQDKSGFASLVDRLVAMQLHGNMISDWRH